jgi:hypothetical protein
VIDQKKSTPAARGASATATAAFRINRISLLDEYLKIYFTDQQANTLMRRRHQFDERDCLLDIPCEVRAFRQAFRIADRKRFT